MAASTTLDLSKASSADWGTATTGYFLSTGSFTTTFTNDYYGLVTIASVGSTNYSYQESATAPDVVIDASKATGTWTITDTNEGDSIIGSSQADTIKVNANETVDSGMGADRVTVSGASSAVTLRGAGATASINTSWLDKAAENPMHISVTAMGDYDTVDASDVVIDIHPDKLDAININVSGAHASVHGSVGIDSIVSTGDYATIDGGGHADSIQLDGNYDSVYLRREGESITVNGSYATIESSGIAYDGGAGITLYVGKTAEHTSVLLGGVNSDSITVAGSYATVSNVSSRGGSEQVDVTGDHAVIYDCAHGSDAITLAGASDYFKSTGSSDRVTISGADDTVDGAANTDIGYEYNLLVLVQAGALRASVVGSAVRNNVLSAMKGSIDASLYGGAGRDMLSALGDGTYADGGAGKDLMSVGNTTASVYGGAGNDSIKAAQGYADGGTGDDTLCAYQGNETGALAATATLNGGAGNDVFDLVTYDEKAIAGSGVTIADYAYGEDIVKIAKLGNGTSVFQSSGAVVSGDITAAPLTSGSNYQITAEVGTTKTTVWYGGDTGSIMDSSASTTSVYMVGDDNEFSDTIIGGSRGDSIFAGEGDYVYGGAGSDKITANGSGINIGLAKNGSSDTISGFVAGYDTSSADIIYLFEDDLSGLSLSSSGTTLTARLGSARLELETSENPSGVLVKDKSGTVYEVAVANASNVITVTDDTQTNIYTSSTGHGCVDFSSVSNNTVIDLGNTGNYGSTSIYNGITTVKGGSGSTKLVGSSSANNLLEAGSGETSLYGGGKSSDTLIGGSAADTFYFGAGDGCDSISGFVYGTEDNADTLALYSGSITSITNSNSGLVINETDGSVLRLNSSAGTTLTAASNGIAFTTDGTHKNEALIGQSNIHNTFVYDSSVTLYYGGQKGDTLQIQDSDNDKIWLDGSQGQSYNGIVLLDGSRASGNIQLAGSTSSNTIKGGSGTSSLWGGSGSAGDTLLGGSGEDSFYFGKGEGNDVIQNSGNSDKVMLYNVSLSDISSAAVTGGTMNISLTDGSTLSIGNYNTNSSVNSFTLADGTSWNYSGSTKQWSKV